MDGYACVGVVVEEGVLDGGCAFEAGFLGRGLVGVGFEGEGRGGHLLGEEGGVDVEAAVFGLAEDAFGDEEADGDGNDEVYGPVAGHGQLDDGVVSIGIQGCNDGDETHIPACECGLRVDGKLELFRQQLDRIYGAVSRRARRV